MPKRLLVHPNERVDLPDFTHAAGEYTTDSVNFHREHTLQGKLAQIVRGFKIELSNQSTDPGQITVHYGLALDRNGELVTSESDAAASKSITLTGNSTTFYLELEFSSSASDVDARAFNDPTFVNTDPIPPGKEFMVNVATRTTPDWSIVTPVSTSGFDVLSDPLSIRIPLAILATNASNEITSAVNPLLETTEVRTTLAQDHAVAATKLYVVDAQLFPDTGTIDVGAGLGTEESVSITGNDRVNNILTINPALAEVHTSAEVVAETSGSELFLKSRATVWTPTSTHPDQRRGVFQGDENRGAALVTSKHDQGSGVTRDDDEISSLRDYVDSVAALLREMKWGSFRPDTAGTTTTFPQSFSNKRYFDFAGSLMGARAASVTIGDGVNTFGDFNGTDSETFSAAIAAVSNTAGEGCIVVKDGTYTLDSDLTVATKALRIIGEGVASSIEFTGSAKLSVTSTCILENLLISAPSTSDIVVQLNNEVGFYCTNCTFSGYFDIVASLGFLGRTFNQCWFTSAVTVFQSSSTGLLQEAVFNQCRFDAGEISNIGVSRVAFNDCIFTGMVMGFTMDEFSQLTLEGCRITLDDGAVIDADSASPAENLVITNCKITGTSTAQTLFDLINTSAFGFRISEVSIDLTWSGTSGGSPAYIFRFGSVQGIIENCNFVANAAQTIDLTDATVPEGHLQDPLIVRGCQTLNTRNGFVFRKTYTAAQGAAGGSWAHDIGLGPVFAECSASDTSPITFPIDGIPAGAHVTRARAVVQPSAVRGAGSRVSLNVWEQPFQVSPSIDALVDGGDFAEDDGSTDEQIIDTDTESTTPITIYPATSGLTAVILAGTGGTTGDRVWSVEVYWQYPMSL